MVVGSPWLWGEVPDSKQEGTPISVAGRIEQMEAELARLKQQVSGASVSEVSQPMPPESFSSDTLAVDGTDEAFPISSKLTSESPDVVSCPPPGPNMPGKRLKFPVKTRLENGFEFYTEDEEFNLQIHNLTQVDGRFYSEPDQAEINDTFALARERLILTGKATKLIDFNFSTQASFDAFTILDAWVNFHFDDRFQVRVGRLRTPFTYEFYTVLASQVINPERSLFFNNFGLGRDVGAMAWGTVFEKRFDYAVGVFNGTRNGFVDGNDGKDVVAYWNIKPLAPLEGSPFQNFQLGASMMYGDQDNTPIPRLFRTVVPLVGSNVLGIPFLGLANDVREVGQRELWSTHLAWFVGGMSLISEWQTGFQNYARQANPVTRFETPVDSFYVQGAYFLTGEQVAGRGVLSPIRPFDIRKGKRGPGAWEPFCRYNFLNVGRSLFDNNLTDGRPWTNEVQSIGSGVNWYWNQYVKLVFEYEHIIFGDPVAINATQTQTSSDLFLLRTQISF
jgi:phosphate-selective porin OprO/OprP